MEETGVVCTNKIMLHALSRRVMSLDAGNPASSCWVMGHGFCNYSLGNLTVFTWQHVPKFLEALPTFVW